MAEETPLEKSNTEDISQTVRIFRPISSGYELKKDLSPKIKRNLPSDLNENKQQKLNYFGQTYNLNNKTSYNLQYPNNNYYAQTYYAPNPFQNSQYHYQNYFYPKSYNYNSFYNYNINQYPKLTPLSSSYSTQTYSKQTNKNLNDLKIKQNNFIPKSMRENNNELNKDGIIDLNSNIQEYTIKNVPLKKKEEEIKKINDDPIKKDLREFLNMLTKGNYEQIKQDILAIIRDNVNYQIKFVDILFKKAIYERVYTALYAKLCKELDKQLPQKNAQIEGENKPKPTSIMRAKLLDKIKEIFQIKRYETFEEYIKDKDPEEREYKLKKFVLGNIYFITELIKIKLLSKKIAPICINILFERYESTDGHQKLKLINLQGIIIFTEQFGSLVHVLEKKIDPKEAKIFKESIDKIFKKLDQVKNEPNLPRDIYYSIINLIEKRKNNYKISKYEEYMISKSKKQVEKELENQITQDNINDRIYKDLIDYKDFIEEEGTSDKYQWKEITYLYDKKAKDLDDILEGYIEGCYDFIEKQSNIKYAKSYIKELIEHYSSKIHLKEKTILKNRLINLFTRVKDFALETPLIYDIYAYVIFIFLENGIMEVNDLEGIIKEKDFINITSSIIKKVYKLKLYRIEKFKIQLAEMSNIKKNKEFFEWVFNQDGNKEEEEKNDI